MSGGCGTSSDSSVGVAAPVWATWVILVDLSSSDVGLFRDLGLPGFWCLLWGWYNTGLSLVCVIRLVGGGFWRGFRVCCLLIWVGSGQLV